MSDSPPGVSFRETLAGGFALGATDPRQGERAGEQAGTRLTIDGAVIIRDLDGFLDDSAHTGELVGHVTFPPLGEDLPLRSGTFNLFSPADRPDTKWMIYELGFAVAGRDYYLAGRKEIRDDPGFDLWQDTTTLHALLHEGADDSGPVIGAGLLHLKPAGLLKLVSSLSATNAGSAAGQSQAIGKFGRFFLGSLWDSYAAHVPGR
jgi:hypothetical protein